MLQLVSLASEDLGQPFDRLGDEMVCFLNSSTRVVHEGRLDGLPARAEFLTFLLWEQRRAGRLDGLRGRVGLLRCLVGHRHYPSALGLGSGPFAGGGHVRRAEAFFFETLGTNLSHRSSPLLYRFRFQ
jgi:hypothetical protein